MGQAGSVHKYGKNERNSSNQYERSGQHASYQPPSKAGDAPSVSNMSRAPHSVQHSMLERQIQNQVAKQRVKATKG